MQLLLQQRTLLQFLRQPLPLVTDEDHDVVGQLRQTHLGTEEGVVALFEDTRSTSVSIGDDLEESHLLQTHHLQTMFQLFSLCGSHFLLLLQFLL